MLSEAILSPHAFSSEENQTWEKLYQGVGFARDFQIHPLFKAGLVKLNLESDAIPDLEVVNDRLKELTGFSGVLVDGHEDPQSFFPMLKQRKFPIGNFIRDAKDLGYTPAPDIFHDLYGHLPFLADHEYANFIQNFGEIASKYIHQPELCRQFERLFWHGLEFSLIKGSNGKMIFGAGLASSANEIRFALSSEPKVLPFDIEVIRYQEFKIDEYQKILFMINDLDDLYQCLASFEKGLRTEK